MNSNEGEKGMVALKIEEQKKFTEGLFLGELFDSFLVTEANIVTFNSFTINGRVRRGYYSDEELEEELKDIAKGYNTDLERVKQIVPSSEVSHGIAMNKALDMIRESAEISEVSPEKTAD